MVVIENKDPHPKNLTTTSYKIPFFQFLSLKEKKNALSFLKGLKNCYSFKVKVVILR